MTFSELMQGATDEEREKCAWFLAMLRARKTYEALRAVPDLLKEPADHG